MQLKKNILKIQFKFKCFHSYNFKFIVPKILKKVIGLGIYNSGFISLPTKTYRYTVLRSPHVDKKSREQFERKVYSKSLIVSFDLTNSFDKQKAKLLTTFVKNSCSGLDLKIKYIL